LCIFPVSWRLAICEKATIIPRYLFQPLPQGVEIIVSWFNALPHVSDVGCEVNESVSFLQCGLDCVNIGLPTHAFAAQVVGVEHLRYLVEEILLLHLLLPSPALRADLT
jgi:hypothetical protein